MTSAPQQPPPTGEHRHDREPQDTHRGPVVLHTVHDEDGQPIGLPLRGLGRVAFDTLLSAHPDPEGLALYAEDSFGPALIAACLLPVQVPVDPEHTDRGTTARAFTEHEVIDWWQTWPPTEVDALFGLCLAQSAPGSVGWALERLHVDERFAAEMAYCASAGLAHSVFLSWSRADQDKAIAYSVFSADRCPGCGVPSTLMDDPGGARVKARRCVHCEALAQYTSSIPEDSRSGVHTHVATYSTAERAQIADGIDPDAPSTPRSAP